MVSVCIISAKQRKKEKKTPVKRLCAEAQLDDGIISQTKQKSGESLWTSSLSSTS